MYCSVDTKTKFAQHGDVGTQVLKEIPNYRPPAYKAGGVAEVSWQVRSKLRARALYPSPRNGRETAVLYHAQRVALPLSCQLYLRALNATRVPLTLRSAITTAEVTSTASPRCRQTLPISRRVTSGR